MKLAMNTYRVWLRHWPSHSRVLWGSVLSGNWLGLWRTFWWPPGMEPLNSLPTGCPMCCRNKERKKPQIQEDKALPPAVLLQQHRYDWGPQCATWQRINSQRIHLQNHKRNHERSLWSRELLSQHLGHPGTLLRCHVNFSILMVSS